MKTYAVCVLCHHHLNNGASTILEHINAFALGLSCKPAVINTELGFVNALHSIKFDVIILHYSLFGSGSSYKLNHKFLNYLKQSTAYKVAFFQDEYRFCQKRFTFLNDHKIDSVYTLLEPEYFDRTYYKYTNVKAVHHTLTGYVDSSLLKTTDDGFIPYEQRQVDISYRARELPYYLGREAQEKTDIAKEFIQRLSNTNLHIDIQYTEASRLYGKDWYKLLAHSKAVIGVEAGVSIFDVDDQAFQAHEDALLHNPHITKEEIFTLLEPWEGHIYYRTISPRVFEAAAFRVCQILFEGKYQNILQPMVHYIPLKKDFSNFDEVIDMLNDKDLVETITNRAYEDLIASKRYSYENFIRKFEQELPVIANKQYDCNEISNINKQLAEGFLLKYVLRKIIPIRYKQFIGRGLMIRMIRLFLSGVRQCTIFTHKQ